jgi:hypothetical protein
VKTSTKFQNIWCWEGRKIHKMSFVYICLFKITRLIPNQAQDLLGRNNMGSDQQTNWRMDLPMDEESYRGAMLTLNKTLKKTKIDTAYSKPPTLRAFIWYPYWWSSVGNSTTWHLCTFYCSCLQNANKHKNRKINNIFLLPRCRPLMQYPYWWPLKFFSKCKHIALFVYINKTIN